MNALQPCGTYAAYKRHMRSGQTPCRPCYAAHAAYERGYADTRRLQARQNADLQKLIHVLAVALGHGRETA